MRILIVEDDDKIGKAIKRGLELEAYAVDLAQDGQDGYDLAATEPYDCIILDWMLPSQSGLDICQQLRQQKITTPILFLTAKDQVADKINGLNQGADDYVAKPFSFEELLARIQALLRRPKDISTPVLTQGPLSLNTTTRQAWRAGQAIDLTAKEYALLHYLISNPNRIVNKQELLDHVWDFEADVLPNTVEVYIGVLRKKIDLPFDQPAIIKTIRGHGYKLDPS